ncbi:type II secretion system F family protein [Sinomonas flava]|uniref:type II secretion system F family protein n=1 Tax=Sinomonas flava TaxID=496857 RepID=UPI0039A6EECA
MSGDWGASAAVAIGLFAGAVLAQHRAGAARLRKPWWSVDGAVGRAARRRRGVPTSVATGRAPWRGRGHASPAEELQSVAILVAQLSALLRAGRSPVQMWHQAAASQAGPGSSEERGARAGRSASGGATDPEGADGPAGEAAFVLSAAARAAQLGRPVGDAIRSAAVGRRRGSRGSAVWEGPWTSVAACIETAEASGSPLAGVLDRLAALLEADADAAAARAVALAGPRATAQVLSVLPVAGLGLGFLMGADPVGVLLSTPVGAACLSLGAILTLAGRWWSARLVRSASEAR